MLIWPALGITEGEVIVPSYTFPATGLGPVWSNLKLKYVDIHPRSLVLDPAEVEKAIGPKTVAIMPVHIWGNPDYPEQFEDMARRHNLKLVFDSAHGLGATYNGRPIGSFGDAEIFSLSPTKLVTGGEGGLIATNDGELARRLRAGRDYGNPGNYDFLFTGMNARMPEFNALLTMRTLAMLPQNLRHRQKLDALYRARLGELPGLRFQEYVPGAVPSNVAFGIIVDAKAFGVNRDILAKALEAERITTRKYYHPLMHKQKAFAPHRAIYNGSLSNSEYVSENVLCLPMYSHLAEDAVERVCHAVERIHVHSQEIVHTLHG
jgi:dTDP-4-amino-4,6-dideoxygalactose transaminase